ncbi:MAG: hypothetical protein L0Z53_21355 [Acidobacteriales bacterium]|nr:hypothetical protein [Terriglobales bacterium]
MNRIRLVMRVVLASGLALGLTVLAVSGARAQTKKVTIQQTWTGIVKDNKLRQEAPANGFVADEKTWSKLWKAWRGDEKEPMVDFSKDLVLVFTFDGPNKISVPQLTLNDKGDLRVPLPIGTLIAGPGFGYRLDTIRREGIQTINGKAVMKE